MRIYTLASFLVALMILIAFTARPVMAAGFNTTATINFVSATACTNLAFTYTTTSDGAATYSADYSIDQNGSPVISASIPLPRNINAGKANSAGFIFTPGLVYTLHLGGEGTGKGSKMKFMCGIGSSFSSLGQQKSTTPVELPPCELSDGRVDETCEGSGVVSVYAVQREDGCYISAYSLYGRADHEVVLLLQGTPGEIAAAQATGGNVVIDSANVVNLTNVTLYWLAATGEFQINAGPNEEGKVYVLNFTGCPMTSMYTTNSYQDAR